MTTPVPVTLAITFGPSRSQEFGRAVEFAAVNAPLMHELEPGRWRASFRLDAGDTRPFAAAAELLRIVHGWKATRVEVDEEPEPWYLALSMLACARGYLRTWGRCGHRYAWAIPPKCGVCPLFDRDRALAEIERPTVPTVPDTVPEAWTRDE